LKSYKVLRISKALKLIQGHWHLYHLIGHMKSKFPKLTQSTEKNFEKKPV